MKEIVEIVFILLLSFILRLIFILGSTSDTDIHLWMVKKTEINRFGRHNAFNSIIPGIQSYPSLTHKIISLFPKSKRVQYAYLLNILYDILNIFLFYVLSRYLFLNVWGFPARSGMILEPHTAVTLIYSLSPILFPVTVRLRTFGGRTFGALLVLIYFTFFGFAFIGGLSGLYIICILVGILIIMSSQFAIQVLVFFSLCLSILYLSLIPFAVVLVTFALGYIIPLLGIRDILRQRVNHYLVYMRYVKQNRGGVVIASRNQLKEIVKLPKYLFTDPLKFLYIFFHDITPIIALYSVPVITILIFWTVVNPSSMSFIFESKSLYYIFSLSIASTAIFILISLRSFLFFGEAERYFEYSVGAISLIFILYVFRYDISFSIIFWVILIQISFIILNFIWITLGELLSKLKSIPEKTLDDLISFLTEKENLRVLSIPTKLVFLLSYHSSNKGTMFYHHLITGDKLDGFKYMEEDEIIYNYIKPDFSYFKEKYRITTVVVDKRVVEAISKKGILYNFNEMRAVYENHDYAVYDIV